METDPTGGLALAFTFAVVIAACTKIVSLIKAVKNKDTNGFVTPILAIVVGVVLVVLVAHSDFKLVVPGLPVPLEDSHFATQVLVGIFVGLSAAFGKDWLNAKDNNASQAEQPLIGPSHPNDIVRRNGT